MEIQSMWRREHYLFDVHAHWRQENASSTNPPQSMRISTVTTTLDTMTTDHGLIYHHQHPLPPTNAAPMPPPVVQGKRSGYSLFMHYGGDVVFYTGSEFDFIRDDQAHTNVPGASTISDDPFSWKDADCSSACFAANFVNNGKRACQIIPQKPQEESKRQRTEASLAQPQSLPSIFS